MQGMSLDSAFFSVRCKPRNVKLIKTVHVATQKIFENFSKEDMSSNQSTDVSLFACVDFIRSSHRQQNKCFYILGEEQNCSRTQDFKLPTEMPGSSMFSLLKIPNTSHGKER